MKRTKKDFRKKAAAAVAIFLVLLMLLSAVAPFILASSNDVGYSSIKAELGYSGLYKVGYPTSVKIEVTAGSGGFNGEALIRVPVSDSSYRGETQYIDYAYPLTINPGENKSVEMDININTIVSYGGLKAELISSDGKSAASTSISANPFNPENMMIGFLSDNPENLSYIRSIYVNKIMRDYSNKRIANLNESNFPTSVGALSAFNVLLINDFDTAKLTNPSLEALKSWLQAGGVLFVGTGENYQKTVKALEGIIAIDSTMRILTDNLDDMLLDWENQIFSAIEEETQLNRDNNMNYANSKAVETNSAESTSEQNIKNVTASAINSFSDEKTLAIPIILQVAQIEGAQEHDSGAPYNSVKVGLGRVVLFHFDLGNSLVSKSPRLTNFVDNIALSEISNDENNAIRSMATSQNGYIISPYNLSNIPYKNSGTVNLLFIAIIVYVFVVGPILYFLLKKRDKKEAGLYIVPFASLGVTIAIFLISYNTIYKRPVVNEISKAVITNGQSSAVKNSNIAVLSAAKGNIGVELKNRNTTLNPFLDNYNYGYSYYGYGNFKPIKVTYGEKPGITYFGNERWDTNVFGASQEVDLGGEISAELFIKDGVYGGTIKNDTPYELKDVIISFGNRGYKNMGNIGAWSELEIKEDFSNSEQLIRDAYTLLWGDSGYNWGNPKSDQEELEQWHKSMYRYALESEMNNYYSYRPSAYMGKFNGVYLKKATDIKLFAFTDTPLGNLDVAVNGTEPVKYYNNMLVLDAKCEIVLGNQYEIPFGYIGIKEIISQGYYDIDMNYGMYVYETNGVEFVIDLSEFNNLQTFQFSSKMRTNDSNQTVSAEILNVSSGKWEWLSYGIYGNPSDYIDSDGILLIRIDCTGINHIYVPEIGVKGGLE